MQGQLELLHLFFYAGYATIAPVQRHNSIAIFTTVRVFPSSKEAWLWCSLHGCQTGMGAHNHRRVAPGSCNCP